MTRAQMYAVEVAEHVISGKLLSEAIVIVLGGIRDGSGPRTSEVADEALKLLGPPFTTR